MSDYDQTKGELCPKCGWAMKFPEEPCRCELERENAALRADKERLDWMEHGGVIAYPKEGGFAAWIRPDLDTVKYSETLRAAIDAARKEQP